MEEVIEKDFKSWVKQINRGYLELLILLMLSSEEKYGWDLLATIRGIHYQSAVTEGTLYGILKRLEQRKVIASNIKKSIDGRNRRYFSLTEKGKSLLKLMLTTWRELDSSVNEFSV